MKCDFCSSERVAWEYPARDSFDAKIRAGSTGAWMACELCHAVIETEDRTALAARGLFCPTASYLLKAGVVTRGEALEATSTAQTHFWNARTGPARRWEGGNG